MKKSIVVLSLLLGGFIQPAKADVVLQWNDMMLDTFASEGGNATPPMNSRTMGMLGGAVFDAVNSVNQGYTPYNGYFNPTTAGTGIDVNAAAAAAAHAILTSVYTDVYGAGNAYLTGFDSLYNTQMSGIANTDAKTRGIEVGLAAAQAMINARSSDGWNAPTTYTPQPLGTPGHWQPGSTPGAWGNVTGTFVKSEWGYVTPFTMVSGSQFRPGGPNGFGNNNNAWVQSSAYTDDFNQVKSLGSASSTTRTSDQTTIAYFWVDGPGTSSPPGHWNRIAQSLSAAQGLSIEDNARLFAMLNLASADAAIAAWDAKRYFDTWRPMLAINTASTDGNPDTIEDALWQPLIPTPSFPAYVSGHSTFSMAGATILASLFGDNYTFDVESESPFLAPGYTRTFNSFTDAAEEAGMSRIYGGIHWLSDNADGQLVGANIGNWVVDNYFQPQVVPEPAGALLIGATGVLFLTRRRRRLL